MFDIGRIDLATPATPSYQDKATLEIYTHILFF